MARVSRRRYLSGAAAAFGGLVAAACGQTEIRYVDRPVIQEKVVTVEKKVPVIREKVVTVEKPVVVEKVVEVPAKAKPVVRVLMDTDWARGSRGEVTKKAQEAFNERYDGKIFLDVRLDIATGGAAKQRALIAADELGEVLLTVSWQIPAWVESGLFNTDIKPYMKQLKIDMDKMLWLPEHLNYKNKIVALPMQFNAFDWVYNKSRFKEKGVPEPTKEWTWDDMLDAAKRLTDPEKNQWGIKWTGKGDHDMWMSAVFANGGDLWEELNGKSALGTPQAIEALTLCLDLIHKHQVTPPLAVHKEQKLSFDKGNYAMEMYNAPGGFLNWRPERIYNRFEWDMMYAPLMKRTGKRAVQLNEQPYALTKYAGIRGNIPEAIQVIAFHAGPVVQGMIADIGGATPAWKAILDSNRFMPPPQHRNIILESFAWRWGMRPHLKWFEWWVGTKEPWKKGLANEITAKQMAEQLVRVGNAAMFKE